MKTSIDLPDSLYRQAKIRATAQGQSFRELLIGALERALYPPSTPASAATTDGPRHFEVDEEGIPVLRRAPEDRTVVTDEFVNELRESEGV